MINVGIKKDVQLAGMQPQTVLAIVYAMHVCQRHSVDFTLTSVCDGAHSRGSLHYKGLAFDMRTRNMTPAEKRAVHVELRNALGDEYDVVLESDHIHVEWDPKK